jgi:hypothetical protein
MAGMEEEEKVLLPDSDQPRAGPSENRLIVTPEMDPE